MSNRIGRFAAWLASALPIVALAVPCAVHGAWNIGEEGARWWTAESGLWPPMRWLIGGGELAATVALVIGQGRRLAAALLAPIFVGAVFVHWPAGFSFKQNGWETPFMDLLLALAIAAGAGGRGPLWRLTETTHDCN